MRIATRRHGELGVALLLALFALVVVTSIGLGMMFLTDTETIVNSTFGMSKPIITQLGLD